MRQDYEPDRGDVAWLELHPQTGHEQAGRRPVLVLSPGLYNQKAGLAIICPITSTIRDYPFIVKIPEGLLVHGVILTDQIKSLDWRARNAKFICKMPTSVLKAVSQKLHTLID